MMWVLKRTVSMRRFFCAPRHMFKLMDKKIIGVRDITGIPVYLDLGVLRYVSWYAFDVPVHSTNSVNFRKIVYLLSFWAVFILPRLIIIEAGCPTANEKLVTMINKAGWCKTLIPLAKRRISLAKTKMADPIEIEEEGTSILSLFNDFSYDSEFEG